MVNGVAPGHERTAHPLDRHVLDDGLDLLAIASSSVVVGIRVLTRTFSVMRDDRAAVAQISMHPRRRIGTP